MKAAFPQWHPLVLALAILAGSVAGLLAAPYQPPVLKPATNGSRFLFVLDMSSSMKATDTANRQALFDLIFTGFDGQMRHGDSFGLWLFNDEVRAGEFPLQIWDEQNPLEAASHAAQFVRAQKYSGKPRLEEVVPKMLQLARVVRDVHLVLVSTGEHPIHGTPFDAGLNEAYARKQAERKKEQKPLITTLNVRSGIVVSASVTLPGQFIQLPERPAPVVAARAADTNKVVTPAAPPAPAPTSDVPRTMVTLTVESGPPSKVWTPAPPATTNPGPRARIFQITTVSNAPAVPPEPAQTNAAAEPPSTLASTPPPTPPPVETAPQEAPVVPAALPVSEPIAIAARETPERMPVVARETPEPAPAVAPAPAPATAPATVIITQPGPSPTLLLAIGATLLAACLSLLVVVLRRLRPPAQGSFITQSMGRQ